MKRFFCLILCVLLVLPGCNTKKTGENVTTFYYCRTEYAYGEETGVVAPEQRDISANASDLKNLLALYLVGPLDEGLTSPFIGTKLISAEVEDNRLQIELTEPSKSMTDARFHLACACMTMTCLDLMELEQVTITCGDRSATMNRDNLLLFDSITPIDTTEETQ